jgi:hypothetical protein
VGEAKSLTLVDLRSKSVRPLYDGTVQGSQVKGTAAPQGPQGAFGSRVLRAERSSLSEQSQAGRAVALGRSDRTQFEECIDAARFAS